MATRSATAEGTIRECLDAFNRCTSEWVETYYAENVEWVELPRQATPDGRRGGRREYRDAAEGALALFPDRQMTTVNLVSHGSRVAVELEWRGTAARSLGDMQAGTVVRARIASFFTVADGLIVKQTDYCVPAGRG